MAKDKKSFVLYSDQRHIVDLLTDAQAGQLLKHLFAYVNDESPQTDDQLINVAFSSIKQQLKRDLKKYEARAERSRENGKSGGRPKKPKETQKTQQVILKPRKPDNDNDNVTVNGNDINIEFEWFWETYDKKTDRKKCEAKFKNLKQQDINKIKATLENYIKSTPDVKFRKNPATYLNNESWNDVIEVPQERKQVADMSDEELNKLF